MGLSVSIQYHWGLDRDITTVKPKKIPCTVPGSSYSRSNQFPTKVRYEGVGARKVWIPSYFSVNVCPEHRHG